MADDSILPLLFLGGAGYLIWKYTQQQPATSLLSATPAASTWKDPYQPLAEQVAPATIPPPAPPSYTAMVPAAGANSANSGPSSPFALFGNSGSTSWSMPGANAPDPSIYRTTPEQALAQAAAADATAHAANVAEGPGSIDLSCYHKCYTTWGNYIAGCVC